MTPYATAMQTLIGIACNKILNNNIDDLKEADDMQISHFDF